MKRFLKGLLAGLALTLGISVAHADNVLIIGGEGNSHVSVQTELEAAGHTVTFQAGSAGPTDLTGYQQVWDMRYNIALSANDMALYDTFLRNNGYLYLSGEHGGFATRNNSIGAFTSSLGGGTISVSGFSQNQQNANGTYFSSGTTVTYAAAATITSAGGRVLSQDASNNATAKMWIGNAGDLGPDYNGTVIVVADINWSQSAFFTAANESFLEQLIRGIVAGTVGGTISDAGNGAAGGGNNAPPAPTTYSQTDANQVVVSDTMAAGTFTGNGGALQAATGTTEISNNMVLNAPGMTVDNNGQTLSLTGSVSGAGGWTFANTGSGGSTTLNGTYTYTGPTTINNGATVINNSNISTSNQLTNLGTFTNSSTGVTGNWINGFNGDGNTAVLNNAGTMGNGTNYGTFNNSTGATVGTVSNVGTFNNAGNTGAVSNMGTFNNNAGGTVSQLAYNNHIINNNGTINSVTYNGGNVNNYGTIGSINNEEAHGTFHNVGSITGTVTTNSTLVNHAGATIAGLYTNSGELTNAGSVGAVTNTGTFANTGTLTSINNSGTFVTAPVTLSTYTQTGAGSTVINYGSVLNVTGAATLDGNLTMLGTAPGVGKHTVLTGAPVTGTFNTYNGIGVLRYTPTGVQIWVMPNGTVVQSQVNNQASSLSSMNGLASSSIRGALGSDCMTFGKQGGCVSVNYGVTNVASGDLNSGGVTIAKSINNNWRAGVFGSQQINSPTVGGIKFDSNTPAVGAFVGWNAKDTGTGFGAVASAVQGSGKYTIGTDTTDVNAQAYQVKGTYTIGVDSSTVATPYIGVRHSTFNVNGYTEQGSVFPITYGAVKQNTTDVLAGVIVAKKFNDKLTGSVSAGVVQNIANNVGTVTASSDMGNFSSPLQGGKYTSAALGAGLSYKVAPNQRIGANFGWQQKSLTNARIASYGVSYTVGF